MFDRNNFHQGVWFKESEIVQSNPLLFRSRNKKIVYDIAMDGATLSGVPSKYVRWRAFDLVDIHEDFPTDDWVVPVVGYYDYKPFGEGVTDWHVNFADPHLFQFYGTGLLAQDETMVAEHPMLAHLREYLVESGYMPLTINGDDPSPVTITDVRRRCSLNVDEIYGYRFASASADKVRFAVSKIDSQIKTNLIAMASIGCGEGRYTVDQIEYLLRTAYTGFAAARAQTESLRCAVHTGFWGCGDFGGNRTLMALIQIVAASMARVDQLVFHHGYLAAASHVHEAREIFDAYLGWTKADKVAGLIEMMRFDWGTGDGN